MPPGPASLRTANLNLIPVLCALLREANVSRAAESLGLSQSATSGALARLRLLLGDPILVQVGRSMRLTPRAEALIVPLEQLVGSLGELLNSAPFDPRAAERRFVVATPDYIGLLIGNALIKVLQEAAPKVSVFFTDVPPHMPDELAAGAIDMAIVDINRPLWHGLSSQPIFDDHIVGLVRRGHPLAGRSLSAQAVRAYPSVRWRPEMNRNGHQESLGHTQLQAQFTVLPFLVLESDCVAEVPKMLADHLGRILAVETLDLPYPPRPIRGGLLWSPVQETDPPHRWFRTLVGGILADLTPKGD